MYTHAHGAEYLTLFHAEIRREKKQTNKIKHQRMHVNLLHIYNFVIVTIIVHIIAEPEGVLSSLATRILSLSSSCGKCMTELR